MARKYWINQNGRFLPLITVQETADKETMMDTDKLMEGAENMMRGLYEGPQNHAQVLMCAQTYALFAIANEMKRMNDGLDYESEVQSRLRDLDYFKID
jgi:hypothetical protein